MSSDFKRCLRKKRIIPQTHAEGLVTGELETAGQDLESARKTFADSDYKWATIQAYYSIFHAARALLFEKGFREKSHFCLKAAIQELYADAGLIEQKHVDDFDATMLLRETADYRSDFSEEGAAASIGNARMFLVRATEILNVTL